MTNYYAILCVSPTATTEEIRSAYRAKARENHPDRGGSEDAFSDVREAWQMLRDPDRRREYDAQLAAVLVRVGAVLCPRCGKGNRVPAEVVLRCAICSHALPTRPRTGRDAVGEVTTKIRERAVVLGDRLTDRMSQVGDRLVNGLSDVLLDGVDRGIDALRRKLGLGRDGGSR